jgi:hypothetical protein
MTEFTVWGRMPAWRRASVAGRCVEVSPLAVRLSVRLSMRHEITLPDGGQKM